MKRRLWVCIIPGLLPSGRLCRRRFVQRARWNGPTMAAIQVAAGTRHLRTSIPKISKGSSRSGNGSIGRRRWPSMEPAPVLSRTRAFNDRRRIVRHGHRITALRPWMRKAARGVVALRRQEASSKLGQLLSSSGWKMRGAAVWRDGSKLRLLVNSRHRLFSLDAVTGKPVPSFGDNGVVSLTNGLPRVGDIKHTSQSSAPTVYKDLVILGSQVPDRVQLADPVGYVQAFNARTGKRVWIFSVIPQSAKDPGAGTWEKESWRGSGHGNVWAPMALDEARGLLYVPTSTPSSDYYGGQRRGANLFAESLVCLEAATGKIKWYFQTVHHGLWDWDNPAPPNLVTIAVNGQRIDAVAQSHQTGFSPTCSSRGDRQARLADRPERPVAYPTATCARSSPTRRSQFPTKPPAFWLAQGLSPSPLRMPTILLCPRSRPWRWKRCGSTALGRCSRRPRWKDFAASLAEWRSQLGRRRV